MVLQRDSSIELLRIVSILMVLNVHTFSPPEDLQISTVSGGDLVRLFFDFFREASSISCVNLFVLISGYFSIRWRVRSISSLIFQVYFWIFLVYVVCLIIGNIEFSFEVLYKHIMGIMQDYWFITVYIGLYVFTPLLNAFVEKTSHKELLWYIIIYYIFFTIDALPYSTGYTASGYSIYSFIGLYLIGRYIRISDFCNSKIFISRGKILMLIIIVTFLITVGALFIAGFFHKGGGELQRFPLSTFAYNNPLVIIQSILIFIFFTKLKFHSKIINWCGTSILALYLLHMHPNLKQDYYGLARQLYSYTMFNQYLSITLLIFAVALIAIPIDKIRMWLFNIIYDKASKLSWNYRRQPLK